jgi:hypothetical protein
MAIGLSTKAVAGLSAYKGAVSCRIFIVQGIIFTLPPTLLGSFLLA